MAFYLTWLLALGFVLVIISFDVTGGFNNLILILPVLIYNFIFFYTYLFDILKRNIYNAKIILLDSTVHKGYGEEMGRVIEGTTIGRRGRTLLLKPRRKTDYVFKVRGPVHGCLTGSIARIKYLKYSKMILEWTPIEQKEFFLLRYSKKDKDYVLSPLQFGKNTMGFEIYRYTMEEAQELIQEGHIEHISYTPGDIAGRIGGGILYGILTGSFMYLLELFMYNNL